MMSEICLAGASRAAAPQRGPFEGAVNWDPRAAAARAPAGRPVAAKRLHRMESGQQVAHLRNKGRSLESSAENSRRNSFNQLIAGRQQLSRTTCQPRLLLLFRLFFRAPERPCLPRCIVRRMAPVADEHNNKCPSASRVAVGVRSCGGGALQ